MSTAARARRSLLIAVVFLLAAAGRGMAQDVTEPSLKAAFVYNFAKFTEWPADILPPAAPFNACVLGDLAVGDALDRAVKGRQLAGHPITVTRITTQGPIRSCHLLYISSVSASDASQAMTAVRGTPVLTISDLDGFVQLGGIAHVFVESGKMRFDLNLELARRSRLQLSSKLLTLATHVFDQSNTVAR